MFKKILAAILALTLVFAFAACGKESKEFVNPPAKKVAILVAPKSEYPEEYLAAQNLAKQYPDKIIIREFSDSRELYAGVADEISISVELAGNAEIGAIVYPRATGSAITAIEEAKARNNALHFVCTEPECSIDSLSPLVDSVITVDWEKAANEIIDRAKEQGAEYFLMFSINRHIGQNSLFAAEREYFEIACKAKGIKFVYDNAFDSHDAGGIEKAKLYVKESVARQILNNKIPKTNVALFSTDSAVQTALIEVANKKNMIYVSPAVPSAYSGIGEAYPVDTEQSFDEYVNTLKAAVTADSEQNAKLSVYNYPLSVEMTNCAVYTAFDILNGRTTPENLTERTKMRFADNATSKELTVTVHKDELLSNVFQVYCPGFENIA